LMLCKLCTLLFYSPSEVSFKVWLFL
jgi:hypothetical protein